MSRTIEIEILPYGRVTIEIYPSLIDGELRVMAVVQNNPFLPIVSASTYDARQFANAILDAVERAEGKVRKGDPARVRPPVEPQV